MEARAWRGAPRLCRVVSPTLLIVGECDEPVLELNREACAQLSCENRLAVVPHATHRFEEQGALNAVAALASEWFRRHLVPSPASRVMSVA